MLATCLRPVYSTRAPPTTEPFKTAEQLLSPQRLGDTSGHTPLSIGFVWTTVYPRARLIRVVFALSEFGFLEL